MTARTYRLFTSACLILGFLSLTRAGLAHRLDEYLQATRISVGLSRIRVEIDLTPGAAVAESIFSTMDTDHDRNISAAEASAYLREFVSALDLSVDDQTVTLRMDEYRFPTVEEMRRGEGVIRLRATSIVRPPEPGQHHLRFMNSHRPDIGAYLVNALASSDYRIRITGQSRDALQREYSMEYIVSANDTAQSLRVVAVLLLLAAAGYGLCRAFMKSTPYQQRFRARNVQ